jgi:hypothetical protein
VIADGRFMFLLVEKTKYRDVLPTTRFLYSKPDAEGKRIFSCSSTGNFRTTSVAFTTMQNFEIVAVDTVGKVFCYGVKKTEFEEDLDCSLPNTDLVATISKVVRVEKSVYAIGGPLRVYKRIGSQQWDNISSSISIPEDFLNRSNLGYDFEDMAGFSESDMYAVGDKGSVWHFDGKTWSSVAFPSNDSLITVTCAGNNQVYITDKNCSVWVGRGSTWKKLVEKDISLSFLDSAWFDDRMWFANDYGIWVLENDQLVLAKDAKHKPIPEDVASLSRHIDISPDNQHMLICGQEGAAVFDGEHWEVLFKLEPFVVDYDEDEDNDEDEE